MQTRLARLWRRRSPCFEIWVACTVLLAASVAAAQGFAPVLSADTGVEVAWLYPSEGLLLAMGEANHVATGIVMARRTATLDARGTLLRAFARLRGDAGASISGAIRRHRLVSTEIDGDRVRVFVAALLDDFELR